MKNIKLSSLKYISAVCVMVIGLSGCDQLGLNQSKVVYVDIAKVLNESSIGKQEAQHNQDIKDVLLKAESDAKEKYAAMSEKQQQQSRAADNLTLNQVWVAEQQYSREVSLKAITEEAEIYRVSHKMDYVMVSTSLLAAKEGADITSDLIKQLEKKKVNYGDLPKISVADSQDKNVKSDDVPQEDKSAVSGAH
ncbi:hypothetical protein [Citrobacter sp.]|uniref:hypothetical protein n=1 Tax=Citrobacter sp. TaxID=1896336 RepID=UPI002FCB0C82